MDVFLEISEANKKKIYTFKNYKRKLNYRFNYKKKFKLKIQEVLLLDFMLCSNNENKNN